MEETEQERTVLEEETPSIIRGVRKVDGASIVEVEGEVDLSTAPQLKDALSEAVDGGGNVILDLSRVGYMDSSGFGMLLGATKRLRPLGGSVHLFGANPSIARMLLITRLNTIIALHETEDAALQAIRASAGASLT